MVKLIQLEFCDGKLVEELDFQVVVLIPKGDGYLHGIDVAEVIWNANPIIMGSSIGKAIVFSKCATQTPSQPWHRDGLIRRKDPTASDCNFRRYPVQDIPKY